MITEVVNLVGDGAGDWEKRGREVYGRPEKREGGKQEKVREKVMEKVVESRRKRKDYATLCRISQYEKCKEEEANKYRGEPGLKGTGSGRFKLPLPPPPPNNLIKQFHLHLSL